MLKRTLRRPTLAVVLFSLIYFATGLAAQDQNVQPSPDAKSLLLSAAASNGAPVSGAKPWHAKITLTLNGWDGKPELEGFFEEFWAAPDKFKVVYSTSSFNQVEYTTPAGVRRTGSRDEAPPEITRIIDQFLHPVAVDASLADLLKLETHDVALGTTKLTCVEARGEDQAAANDTYCVNTGTRILRLVLGPGGHQRTLRNNIVKFQDHYLPKSVERVLIGPGEQKERTQFTATLETLEAIDLINEAQLTPPPDATPPPQVITLEEKTTRAQLQQHAPPVYPPIAKAARVSGDVVISLQIQTDGRVSRLRVLSGPPMLQQAGLDGVKKWVYRPFERDGQPVEVNTMVTVTFRLIP